MCGGFLGLFMGVSMISIIEIFYYSTLRLFWIIRSSLERNEEQSEPRDVEAIRVDNNIWTNQHRVVCFNFKHSVLKIICY